MFFDEGAYKIRSGSILLLAAMVASGARAQDSKVSDDELAKELQNPLADLISVPIQNNFEFRGGRYGNGFQWLTNIQPVVPFSLTDDWNLVTRTILPIVYQSAYEPNERTGLGDTLQSFFLTPKQSIGGLILGAGPVFLWPTATDDRLGSEKWGAGPTAVALTQQGPWTIGGLGNHVWSYAGAGDRGDVSVTFLQPFVAYAVGRGMTFSMNTESTYDWVRSRWTAPVNVIGSQVFEFGKQAMSLALGAKYFAVRPDGAPRWGLRATLTLLFPK